MSVGRAEVAWTDDGARVVVLRLEALDEHPVVLVDSAAEIWRQLEEPTSVDLLVEDLAAAFEIDPLEIEADVRSFLAEASRLGIVTAEVS